MSLKTKKLNKGLLITFEGPEKSGKSTQACLLMRHLKKQGYLTLFIREPGSTAIGEKIRRILLDKKNLEMTKMSELLLYVAARAQLVEEVIQPALKEGKIVLCDRFSDSTICYQGYGCGLELPMLKTMGKFALRGLKPDLTLLLDFWKSESFLKNHKAPDRIEMRSDVFHKNVKKGYFALAKKEPRRIKVIRVAEDRHQTQARIRECVEKCIQKNCLKNKMPRRS